MKSKKATEAIERYRKEFTAGFVIQNEIERVNEHCRLFTEVVEIAEADRDAKAVEAFRESCPYHFEGWCHKYSSENEAECEGNDDCGHQDNFIQKLNEE